MDQSAERRLHDEIGFVGLRAQATVVGFIQLCAELCRAGLLDAAAMDRIKDAVATELALSRPRTVFQTEFENARRRVDEIFSGREALERRGLPG